MGVTVDRARQFQSDFYTAFPTIQSYIAECHKKAMKDGFVITLSGRKRPLDNIHSETEAQRSAAKR